jgi:MFS family permease
MTDPLLRYPPWRVAVLGLLALLTLVPVTLPVPVLRGLVQERFGVSETLTSLFMSLNMVGAALTAPLAGVLADRFGRRDRGIALALLADGLCFFALARPVPFGLFLAIRFLEGCAHIFALSQLLALASSCGPADRRGRVMGLVGAGLLLGVAIGAPLGGLVGRDDPLVPLYLGGALGIVAAAIAWATLIETESPGERRPGLRAMARLLRDDALLAVPLAFAFVDRFTVGFYTTTLSLFLGRIHQLPPPRIGLLIAIFMLPFALLSVPLGRISERVSRALLLCGGSLVYGVGTASLTWWSVEALPFVMAAVGASAAVMFVPSLLLTTELAPAGVRSTALGAFNAAGSLGFIVGPITGGLISEQVALRTSDWLAGYRAAFGVAGGVEVLLALAALPLLLALGRRGH